MAEYPEVRPNGGPPAGGHDTSPLGSCIGIAGRQGSPGVTSHTARRSAPRWPAHLPLRHACGHVDRHHRRPPCPRRHGVATSSPSTSPAPRPGPCSKRQPSRTRRSTPTPPTSAGSGCTSRRTLGGSGYGLEEVVVVVEELGRALAPGAFVPTLIASAVLVAVGPTTPSPSGCCPASPTVRPPCACPSVAAVELRDGALTGGGRNRARRRPRRRAARRRSVTTWPSSMPTPTASPSSCRRTSTRRAAPAGSRSTASPAEVIPGARRSLVDLARTIIAAEAVGVARECTDLAAAYSKERLQFGRPIAMFQAVKHHCANMAVATELATAAVWDAARAAAGGGDQFSYAAAVAASLADPRRRPVRQPRHAGPRRHRLHVGARLPHLPAPGDGDRGRARRRRRRGRGHRPHPGRASVASGPSSCRPRPRRSATTVRAFVADARRARRRGRASCASSTTGYAMPHWPQAVRPRRRRHRAAGHRAGVRRRPASSRPQLRHHRLGHPDADPARHRAEQVSRWVRPALTQEVIWCQLFSEPDAGSDAAGIKTSGTRVDGGWLVNGQKVWTSGAHVAGDRSGDDPHRPRRAEAQRHHDDGHRHARARASRCGR